MFELGWAWHKDPHCTNYPGTKQRLKEANLTSWILAMPMALFAPYRSIQVLHQHVWGGGGKGSSQNADTTDTFQERGGGVETRSKYYCKMLEIINKKMNFFLNHAQIFWNKATTAQNIFLMII